MDINSILNGGGFNESQTDAISKALAMQAGQISGYATVGQNLTYEGLKIEDLDPAIKSLEKQIELIHLWNNIPKLKGINTNSDFNQLVSYGSRDGGFYQEGEAPDINNSQYRRKQTLAKFIMARGGTTLQVEAVTLQGNIDAYQQEVKNKMMLVLDILNRSLAFSNSNMIPESFDGIYTQHSDIGSGATNLYASNKAYFVDSNTVIDLRGKSLKTNDIAKSALLSQQYNGYVNTLFAPPAVILGFSTEYNLVQRIILSSNGYEGGVGTAPKMVTTAFGDVNLISDLSLQAGLPANTTTPASNSLSPTKPTTVAVAAVVSDSLSQTVAGEAGNVFYAVAAINRKGSSDLTTHASPVAIAAGASVDITITAAGTGNAATAFQIYRTLPTSASSATGLTFYPIFRVSVAQVTAGYDGGAAGVVRDRDYFMASMEQAFACALDSNIFAWKELKGMSKVDLPINTAGGREFLCFTFGTPQVFAPKKIIRFINVNPTYTP